MNNTSTPTPISVYFAWQKSLFRDEILRKLASKSEWDIRATAVYVSTFGTCGQHCRPSADTVAAGIGCTERTVRTHMKDLVSLGWFTADTRPGRTTVYSIANPGNETTDPGNLDFRGTPETWISDDQEHKTKNIDQEPLRGDQEQDQEHVGNFITDDQESYISMSDDQESVLVSPPKAAPDRQEEKAKGPWCGTCDTPLISNDQDHKDKSDCEYVCTACGDYNHVELRFDQHGKAWYRCPSCGTYLIEKNNVLVERVKK